MLAAEVDRAPRGWERARRGARSVVCGLAAASLTLLTWSWLFPPAGLGPAGLAAHVGRDAPVVTAAGLFTCLAWLIRYWVDRVSPTGSGRDASGRRGRRAAIVVLAVTAAACGGALVRARIGHLYRVDGPSMLPTFEPGDLVMGRRYDGSEALRRGEVVVFRGARSREGEPPMTVKRVVGLPGDRVEMRGGTPVINGWVVPSCDAGDYLYARSGKDRAPVHGRLRVEFLDDDAWLVVTSMGASFTGAYAVQPDEVFVLGDDRGNSLDSRSLNGGRGGGVRASMLEARAARYLLGTQRDGALDALRAVESLVGRSSSPRLGGAAVGDGSLRESIARCLAHRPAVTSPPSAAPGPVSLAR